MRFPIANGLRRFMCSAAATIVVTPVAGVAANIPVQTVQRAAAPVARQQTQSTVSATGGKWQPHRLGPHVFYGKITAMNGPIITVHLRNGHILDVDAGAAIANGDYSAPLFVGKLISVDGVEGGGKFTAAHIFRLTNLGSLRGDQ